MTWLVKIAAVSQTTNFDCYYCNYKTNIDKEYERNVITRHPNKLCYPSKTDFEKLSIVAKGKSWEI